MQTIVVLRLSALGDVLHTLPAFRLLRGFFPENRILWVAERRCLPLLEMVEGVDALLPIDTRALRRGENLRENLRALGALGGVRPELSLDFQGTWKSAFTGLLLGSKERLGFARENLREGGASLLYTKRAAPFDDGEHVTRKNLHLLTLLGLEPGPPLYPGIRIPAQVQVSLGQKLGGDSSRRILLNVGGAWKTKRWPSPSWAKTALGLKERGYDPLLLWGSPVEEAQAWEISRLTEGQVLPTPFLTLQEVTALLKGSLLTVSADSFPLHMADALGRLTVGLFGPTPPRRNGPLNPLSATVTSGLECSFCFRRECDTMACMNRITPENLLLRIEEVLTKGSDSAR